MPLERPDDNWINDTFDSYDYELAALESRKRGEPAPPVDNTGFSTRAEDVGIASPDDALTQEPWWNSIEAPASKEDGYIETFAKGVGTAAVIQPMKWVGDVMGVVEDEFGSSAGQGEMISTYWGEVLRDYGPQKTKSTAKRYVGMIGSGIGNLISIGFAGVTGGAPGAAAALSALGAGVGAEKYNELRKAGYGKDQARSYGIIYGLAEAIPSAVGVGKLASMLGGKDAAMSLMKKVGTGFFVEGAEETVTEIIQAHIDYATTHPNMTWGEYLSRLRDSAVVGGFVGGVAGAAIHPFSELPGDKAAKKLKRELEEKNAALKRQTERARFESGSLPEGWEADTSERQAVIAQFADPADTAITTIDEALAAEATLEPPKVAKEDVPEDTGTPKAAPIEDPGALPASETPIEPAPFEPPAVLPEGRIEMQVEPPSVAQNADEVVREKSAEPAYVPSKKEQTEDEFIVDLGERDRQNRNQLKEGKISKTEYDSARKGLAAEEKTFRESNIGAVENASSSPRREGKLSLAVLAKAQKAWAKSKTDSPFFKKWFGSSKVVDEKGEAKVVYHGTTADITEFDTEKIQDREHGWFGAGFYFGGPRVANNYVQEGIAQEGNPNVMPVYLSLRNPLRDGKDLASLISQANQSIEGKHGSSILTKEVGAEFTRLAKEAGYDGIIAYEGQNYAEYVAFYPSQIKSATGNQGTFGQTSPAPVGAEQTSASISEAAKDSPIANDIRLKEGGEVPAGEGKDPAPKSKTDKHNPFPRIEGSEEAPKKHQPKLPDRYRAQGARVVSAADLERNARYDLLGTREIGKILGLDVRVFSGVDAVGGFRWHKQVESGGKDVLWLNVNLDTPSLAIFGHEVGHILAEKHADLYQRLKNAVMAQAKEGALESYLKEIQSASDRNVDDINKKRAEQNPPKQPRPYQDFGRELLIEEFVSDYIGKNMLDSDFIENLLKDKDGKVRELGKKIVLILRDIVGKLREAFGLPQRPMRHFGLIESSIEDTAELRALLAETIDFVAQREAERIQVRHTSPAKKLAQNKAWSLFMPTGNRGDFGKYKKSLAEKQSLSKDAAMHGRRTAMQEATEYIKGLVEKQKRRTRKTVDRYEKRLKQLAKLRSKTVWNNREALRYQKVVAKWAKELGVEISHSKLLEIRTEASYSKVLTDVIWKGRDNGRKRNIAAIAKVLDGREAMGTKLAPAYITQLEAIASWFDKVRLSDKKRSQLEKFDKDVAGNPEERMKITADGRKMLQELLRLDKQALGDLTYEESVILGNTLEAMLAQGMAVKMQLDAAIARERSGKITKLRKDSASMDGKKANKYFADAKAGLFSRDSMRIIGTSLHSGWVKAASTDIVMQLLDGGKKFGAHFTQIFEPLNRAHQKAIEERNLYINRYNEELKSLEAQYGKESLDFTSTISSFTKIMIHGTLKMDGGFDRLSSMEGFEEALAEQGYKGGVLDKGLRLNEAEGKLYVHMRETLDELHPQVGAVYIATEGKPLGFVENFFPWMIESHKIPTSAEAVSAMHGRPLKTKKGFTKTRQLNAKQALNLNAEEVFLTYINRATYYTNMEMPLRNARALTTHREGENADTYRKEVGDIGYSWMDHHLSVFARNGANPTQSEMGRFAGRLIKNLGRGVLGFRLSPILKQPIAKITSSALLGPAAFGHDAVFFKEKLWKYVDAASVELQQRVADDPTFINDARSRATSVAGKAWNWQQENAYQGIKFTDKITASNVWFHAYRKSLKDQRKAFSMADFKAAKIDKIALRDADYVVRRTQGSSAMGHLSQMFTHDSELVQLTFSAIFQFQSFVLNEAYLLHDAVQGGKRGAKAWQSGDKKAAASDFSQSAGILMAFIASGLAEQAISIMVIAPLFSDDDFAKKKKEESMGEFMFEAIAGKIPIISTLNSVYRYDGRTGVAVLDTAAKIVYELPQVLASEASQESKNKTLVKSLGAAASLMGVGGAGQVEQIIRKQMPKKVSNSTRRRRRRRHARRRGN